MKLQYKNNQWVVVTIPNPIAYGGNQEAYDNAIQKAIAEAKPIAPQDQEGIEFHVKIRDGYDPLAPLELKGIDQESQDYLWSEVFDMIYGNTLDPDYSNRHEILKSKFHITRI